MFGVFYWFGEQAAWIETVLRIASVFIVLAIIKNTRHLSTDIIWIVLIISFPVFGSAMYILVEANLWSSETFQKLFISTDNSRHYYVQDPEVLKEIKQKGRYYRGQFNYISQAAGWPFYRNTGFDYYSTGDEGFPVMLEELKKAEKFIFLEYFIIEEGKMWNAILQILEEKAAQGVDVRVMYDDAGSFFTLSPRYARKLEKKGIRCLPFNRINPIIGIIMNHRDHRKIMVIDGKVACSGGINLADEYINVRKRFGYWKDNVYRVTGEAVWSFTVMFLTHWNALRKTDDDFETFKVEQESADESDGYLAPYGETPLDDEITAQNIYMGILSQANDYCYIMTPYLLIDTEMINALILAAKRGVDVRILTPGIPDKKLVFQITRSYYRQLLEGGVKIYEYTPGFVHSKVFVADDLVASVGTVNLD
ncbi:MAG: cardiolipin synthase [Erysipelotrichaceae bacterium]|nr:cardiolipin synthase [Erysipelotrichaceae bacterium]